ncbi:uncharacterized protein [Dysidea avara]|uniref:uncharacterized protein n=1 Tax=Dysidea avara TaxID=196820 RepID=UPI0033314029
MIRMTSDGTESLSLAAIRASEEQCASKPIMKDLSNLVTPEYAAKWRAIGAFLGLTNGRLDIIDSDNHSTETCCNKMWQRWLDTENNATWGKVVAAIDAARIPANTQAVPLPHEVVDIVKTMCINKRSKISEDDWPPYQPETYTTVALIHHKEKIAFKEAVLAIAKKAHKGKVKSPGSTTNDSTDEVKSLSCSTKDSYLSRCKYIKQVSDIFPVDSTSRSYTVLIEGAPGIGKTILTKEIAFLWANGTILEDTKLLISIYLRDPSVHKISNCTDFAQYITSTSLQNMMNKCLTNYLTDTCGTDIMFVFDGYDELPESLRQESFIASIINRKMFPCSKIVITSRPSASARLHKKVECRIEILGFTDDDRRIYITRALNNDLEKVEKTFAYLEDNPVINSLCYIPLNMSIFICLLRSSVQSEFPTTQTEINNRFICMTISRYFLREEKEKLNIISLFDMPAEHMGKLKELSKLAFDLLGNDKIVFNYTDIKIKSQLFSKNLNGLGLLKAVKHFSFTDNCEQVSFNFLHFSLQEFLAAFHVASSPNTEQHRIMNENFWNDRYLNMWIMYFGLTKGNSRPLLHFLSGSRFNWLAKFKFKAKDAIDESIIEDKIKCLHLFQCFLEAGNETMCQQVGNFLNDFIIDLSGQAITSRVMHTLGFFLTRFIHKEWEVLNLSNCYINNKYVKILSKSCLSDQANNLSIKILDISSNNITSSALHEICKLVVCLQVQKLIILNDNISDEEISVALLNVIIDDDSCNFCVSLSVVSSQGTTNSASFSLGSPYNSTSFEDTTSEYVINCKCNQMLKHITNETYFSHAQRLFLWNSILSVDDLKMLARNNANLQISIVNTNLDDGELDYLQSEFQECLASNSSLAKENAINYIMKSEKRLLIFGANIQHSILIFKNTFTTLSLLQVTDCQLTPAALHCIGAIISRNRISWEMVDLTKCNIDNEGFAILCSYFPSVASDYINVAVSIKVFNISGNCLSSLSVPTIMNSLRHCIVNQYILSHNNVPQQELSDAVNTQLHTQFVSANFLQKHPLIIVNDVKQLSTQLKLNNRDTCNVYIINCEIDSSVFKTVLQKQWTINELILANNDFYKDKLHIFSLFLPNIQILKLNIFQASISDEVALESLTNLKKVTEVEYTLLSQTKLMCNQTCDKQIDKIISQISHTASNTINYLQITDCQISCNEVLDAIFSKCSSKLQLIDFTGSSIKDKGCLALHTYLASTEMPLHLKVLNLTGNNLTSYSIDLLVGILHSSTIEKLIIAHNNLYPQVLHNAILQGIQSNSNILNFNSHIPLTVITSISNSCGNLDQSKNSKKYAYIYFVNTTITKHTMNICNELSEENVLVYKLVFCNNEIIVKSDELLTLSLEQDQYVKIKSISGTCNCEREDDRPVEVIKGTNRSGCILIYKNKLLCFKMFHCQIFEVLSQRVIDQLNLDTLQLINCNIPSSVELSQLGRIISSSKRQWKCIDISGCNIEDRGCGTLSRMCKDYTKIDDVTVKVLNLSNNGLTMASLKDISTIVLLWKVEKVVISRNNIPQYDLSHTISAMAKHEIFKQYSFQIEVGAVHKSIIIHNHSNCKQYLSKILTFEKAMFGKMISNNLIDSQQILRSSTIAPPLLESYNTSAIALPDVPQDNLNIISSVTVGMHDTQLYLDLKKGIIPYRNYLYVTQEAKFMAPIQHIHVINSNITAEIACHISETISSGRQLESMELVSNNVEEKDIIKIVTALQCTSTLLYLCVSKNVVSNNAAQTFALAISCNVDLEHFHLSHCELREQGMLTIIRSLRSVTSLKYCNLSGNYITDKCATELASIMANNSLLSHLNLSNCKLQENGLFFIVDTLKKILTLTYLDLSSNRINDESAVLLSNVIDMNNNLSHVDLSRCMLKEKGLIKVSRSLSKLVFLKYIDLSFNEISDHVAQNLAPALKNASHVFLNNCNLKRRGIEKISLVLEIASSVRELGLSKTCLTAPVIKNLAATLTRNINLNHLSVASCGLKGANFQPILQATEISSSIKYLDISGNAFDGATSRSLGEHILRHNTLQHLQISSCSFKEDGLKYIFKCLQFNKRNFYYLDTSYNHISNDAALQLESTITSNYTLKHLILHHCDVKEQGFVAISKALKSIGCLRTLNLNYNKTSDNVAYELGEAFVLNSIFSHLEMVSCNLTDIGVKTIANSLSKISSLTHLNISYNSISDAAADKLATALSCNTSLQHLDVSYCNLDRNGFCIICKSLLTTSTLRHLNVSDNKISNSVAEVLTVALSKISTLNYLILYNCDIPELGFDILLGTLCCNNVLHHLNVNCNIISDQTAAKICEVIAASTFLTELEIGSCNISGHGFRLIAESLMKHNKTSLEHIDMSFNTILFSAAKSISTTLHANTSLEYLDLSGCKLGEREFAIICKSLSNNVLLTYLNVSHNIITSEVAAEIASIIDGNRTLQYVNFSNCNLRDDGIKCIADALCNVKTLRTFIASHNPAISNDTVKHIANIITNNTFLEHFDLSNCNLQEASTSVISQAAKNASTMKCLILD